MMTEDVETFLDEMDDDDAAIVRALGQLADRSGCSGIEIGHDTGPKGRVWWYAEVRFGAQTVAVTHQHDPVIAAYALSVRLLRSSVCKCGKAVSVVESSETRCGWRLTRAGWVPSCDAAPIKVASGERGNSAVLREAYIKRHGPEALDQAWQVLRRLRTPDSAANADGS